MSFRQFLSILRARFGVTLLILLATLAVTAAWLMLRTPAYTARAPLLVDARTSDPVPGSQSNGNIPESFIATQIDIIKSDRVAERVVQMLELDKDPKASESWQKEGKGVGTLQSWLARGIQGGLEVRPARQSNIINVSWTGSTPAGAAQVANAFAQAYVDTTVELRTDPARRYSVWFEDQLREAKQNLQQAQMRLSEFQQRAGIVSSDERVDHETARLNELSSQLSAIQGETTDSQNKRVAPGDTVAEVIQSALINGLKADIARLEAKVQESGARLGPGHPTMVSMNAELSSLRSRLATETAKINASINTTYQVGKGRERELQAAVAAQRARVLALNKQRGELSLLQRDVDTAQKVFEAVSSGASQSKLQSLTNQTNVMRLAAAVEPMEPLGLKTREALVMASVAGLLLGMAGAFLVELANRRVRSVEDLSMALQLPVLASIPAASSAALATLRLAGGGSRRLAIADGRSPA